MPFSIKSGDGSLPSNIAMTDAKECHDSMLWLDLLTLQSHYCEVMALKLIFNRLHSFACKGLTSAQGLMIMLVSSGHFSRSSFVSCRYSQISQSITFTIGQITDISTTTYIMRQLPTQVICTTIWIQVTYERRNKIDAIGGCVRGKVFFSISPDQIINTDIIRAFDPPPVCFSKPIW